MPSRAATTSLPRRAFVACLYAGCATGSFYGFGIYGGAIQSSLGLSDASLANINTVPYALGFVSAPLAGRVTKAFGPAAGLLLGGAIQAALQVAMYAIATGAAPTGAIDPGTALVLCACVVYVGGQLISSAAFSTPVLHFRRKRGRVVSLVKAFVGLSGAVVSQTYVVAFGVPSREPGALRCLLIWAAISAGTCFFGAACIPRSPSQQSREPAALLRLCFWLLLLLCGASMAASLVPQTGSPLHTGLVGLLGLLALSPLPLALGPLLPLLAPARSRASPGGRAFPSPRRAPLLAGPEAALPWLSQPPPAPPPAPPSDRAGEANDGSPGEEAAEEAARREAAGGPVRRARAAGAEPEPFLLTEARTQLSLPQMLRRPDSWLLWLAGCAAIGGGNFFATNVGQLVRASGSHPQLVAQLVTLFSTGNMLGRLVGCDASDRLFVRRGRSRCGVVVMLCVGMAAAHGLLLAAQLPVAQLPHAARGEVLHGPPSAPAHTHTLLLAGALLAGTSFGTIWPHLVVLASELFGSDHLHTNYLFYDGGCGATGTLLLANLLPRLFHRRVAASSSASCDASCFVKAHAAIAAIALAGAVAAVVLARRSAPLYTRIGLSLEKSRQKRRGMTKRAQSAWSLSQAIASGADPLPSASPSPSPSP